MIQLILEQVLPTKPLRNGLSIEVGIEGKQRKMYYQNVERGPVTGRFTSGPRSYS
jgi:hypothetical protein